METVTLAKIADIDAFHPSKVSDSVLVQDHRLTHIWWSELSKGNEVVVHEKNLSKKRCRELHAAIVNEMESRGMKHQSVLKRLSDEIVVVPHFVSIVGSAVQDADSLEEILAKLEDLRRLAKADSTLGAIVSSRIHRAFTVCMDDLAGLGHMDVEQRKTLSGAIGDALDGLKTKMEDLGVYDLMVPAEDVALVLKGRRNGSRARDVDILYRAEPCEHNAGLWEGLTVLMRKEFDPDKTGDPELHHVFSGAGPHATYLPLYDLVLRPVRERQVVTVKQKTVRLNLGCGPEKLEGYVNIDARPEVEPDVVHDLNRGIPWPDNSVDEVRAWHLLEHLVDKTAIMEEIWRVLKPGGLFLFEVPSTEGEGAFADPTHKSYWNRLSFQFYSDRKLREASATSADFEIVELEEKSFESPYWSTVHVRGKLRARKPTAKSLAAASPSGMALQAEDLEKQPKALKPFADWTPPKPQVAEYTDFLSSSELWDHWAKDRIEAGLDVEVKLNGYRTVVEKAGSRIEIAFENIRDRARAFPDLAKSLGAIPDDYILDCDMGMVRAGKRLARTDLDPLLADSPELDGAEVVLTAFDLPYWNEDLHEKPWTERRKALEEFFAKYLKGKSAFAITQTNIVRSRSELEAAIRKVSGVAMSEGAVVKTVDGPYAIGGSTNEWSKVKHVVELKVAVIDKKENAGGSYTYTCGLLKGRDEYTNVLEHDGRRYIDVGGVSDDASYPLGAVLTVQVQELVSGPDKDGDPILYWVVPTVIDRDEARKEAYYANQAVDIARRAHVLQEPRQKVQTTGQLTCPEILTRAEYELVEIPDLGLMPLLKEEDAQGEPRGERFLRLWEQNWQRMWPPGGSAQFVYHHHWMGIAEEDAGKDEDELRRKGYRYHGDLRCQFSARLMFHPVIFKPDPDDDGVDEFAGADHAPSFQCTWYGPPPVQWLKVGRGKPYVAKPGEAGASAKAYGVMFAAAYGTWDMGVWHRHNFELFLKDEKGDMKGRLVISSVPRPSGERFWLAQWPEDQTPIAEDKTLDEVAEERRKKGDRWLVWAKPGEKPQLVDLKRKGVAEEQVNLEMRIVKAVEEEHLVYGPVLKPWPYVDLQNDTVRAEEIRKAAHFFMERFQQIGDMHIYDDPRLRVVESYLAPVDFELEGTDGKKHEVVEGTWIMGVRVNDPREWERVKKGERTGFSIEGRARRIPRKRSEVR